MLRERWSRILRPTVTYLGILAATLAGIDLALNMLGLFTPTHRYGDAELGWRPARASDSMQVERCIEESTQEKISFVRNEDGVRTHVSARTLLKDTAGLRIAVTGDSQTDLCARNVETHAGVLERELNTQGVDAIVLPFAAGKYSPLQAYLAFRAVPREYHPQAMVMNIYTGNDFYDMLRVDDRPHFVSTDTGYRIAEPVWFMYDNPTLRRRSRVLYALRSLADQVGLRSTVLQARLLRRLAAEHGYGMSGVLPYMRDLRKSAEPSLGYPTALTAQMLNQQLFFQHFSGAREEALRRVRALMELVQRENPGMLVVMSPLPSYQLAGRRPLHEALSQTLERLPLTNDGGVREEEALYERLRALASEFGWPFADNLAALRRYNGDGPLYNDFDFHLLPAASEVIGQEQARVLLRYLRASAE